MTPTNLSPSKLGFVITLFISFDFNIGLQNKKLGKVIRGWDEGLLQMQLGEKSKVRHKSLKKLQKTFLTPEIS